MADGLNRGGGEDRERTHQAHELHDWSKKDSRIAQAVEASHSALERMCRQGQGTPCGGWLCQRPRPKQGHKDRGLALRLVKQMVGSSFVLYLPLPALADRSPSRFCLLYMRRPLKMLRRGRTYQHHVPPSGASSSAAPRTAIGTRRRANGGKRPSGLVSATTHASMRRPDVSTSARFTAVGLEDVIRHDALETGALIASDGRTLKRRQGVSDRVHFTEAELRGAVGGTFTHNHPGGTGPSVSDVEIGIEYRLHEVRVVTPIYRFIVSRLGSTQVSALQAEYALEERRVEQTLRDAVRLGAVHRNDFGHEMVHRTWDRVSNTLGFIYWRERS